MINIINVATKQSVRIKPASFGKLYPRVVLEKTGLTNGIILAAIVIINQLTGQRKWSTKTLKSIMVFRTNGTPGIVNHHLINSASSEAPQLQRRSCWYLF